MKKILSLIAIAISLLSSQAYAKTEGNYVGINLLKSTAKIKNTSTLAIDNEGGNNIFYNHNNKNSKYGFGLNYKYAFNFNSFFVAPEISYEFLNNEISSGFFSSNSRYFSQKVKLKNAISLKSNFGYDFNDQFAFYIPIGIFKFGYDIETADVSVSSRRFTTKSNNESVIFAGFGLSYEPLKNWVLNLEYNKYQDFKLTSLERTTLNNGKINAKTNLDAIKFGLSYRF
jgi:opacity protein-like surface antigen